MKAAVESRESIDQHFAGREPRVREIYDHLLDLSRRFGPVQEEAKKTSIHLARRSSFAGVATRRDALILTINSATDVADPRIFRHEQVSANRWHLEVRITQPQQLDGELEEWLKEAYELAG